MTDWMGRPETVEEIVDHLEALREQLLTLQNALERLDPGQHPSMVEIPSNGDNKLG
jgi:hypothetical protein